MNLDITVYARDGSVTYDPPEPHVLAQGDTVRWRSHDGALSLAFAKSPFQSHVFSAPKGQWTVPAQVTAAAATPPEKFPADVTVETSAGTVRGVSGPTVEDTSGP